MPHLEWQHTEALVFRKKQHYRIIQVLEAKWSTQQLFWNAHTHQCTLIQAFHGLVPTHSMPLLHFIVTEGTADTLHRIWETLREHPTQDRKSFAAGWLIHNLRELEQVNDWIAPRQSESHLFVLDTRAQGLAEAAQPHWKTTLRELKASRHDLRLLWNPWTQALKSNRSAVNPWDQTIQTEVAHAFHALCTEQGFSGILAHGLGAEHWQTPGSKTQLEARQAAVQWLGEQATQASIAYEGLPKNETWPHQNDVLHTLAPAFFKKHPVPQLRAMAYSNETCWTGVQHFYLLDHHWYHKNAEALLQSLLTSVRILGGVPIVRFPEHTAALDLLWNALAVPAEPKAQWKWRPSLLELQGHQEHCYINLSSRKQQLPGHAFQLSAFESIVLRQA
jgi:hypothetical protein